MAVFPPYRFRDFATVGGQIGGMTQADFFPGTPGFLALCLLGYGVLVNLLAFVAVLVDGRRVRAGLQGLPGASLLLLAFLGGWPGTMLGWLACRDLPQQRSFALLLHLAGLILPLGLAVAMVAQNPAPMLAFADSLRARIMPNPAPEAQKPDLPRRFGPGADGTLSLGGTALDG